MLSNHLSLSIFISAYIYKKEDYSISFIILLITKRKYVIILSRENVIRSTTSSTSSKAVVDRKEKCYVQQRSGSKRRGAVD